ncbi:ankyrin repeat domain-containing protein 7-like [Camelus ferus]|uniref:Ankyrin repeat domain-containing protein 7-like n=1 Tax=Camelus ferus TaxID=419612 RepID=A0A8B8TM33_CAMFR|nr:ankyrin repeat domain-containing protein 7-like [Camelus ferus]
MKKVIKFTSWVGLRNLERPEPSYITDKSELPKLHRAACSGYDETLRKLLSRKKNAVDSRDKNGRTPLHLACISGCPGVVALLIQFNCDLNARDKERTTALIRVCSCQQCPHHIWIRMEEMIDKEKNQRSSKGISTSF